MHFRKANNPTRIHTTIGRYEYLLQIDTGSFLQVGNEQINLPSGILTITKTRMAKKPASKCEVLYEGSPEDFAANNKGILEYEFIDYERAFKNFLLSLPR